MGFTKSHYIKTQLIFARSLHHSGTTNTYVCHLGLPLHPRSSRRKHINTMISNRLVKMRLALLQYDLEVTYLPGRQMLVADLLSRNFLESSYDNEIKLEGYVHNLNYSKPVLNRGVIISETKSDENLTKVIQYCKQGWPNCKSSLPKNEFVRHYAKHRNELIVCEDNLLYFNNRVVIPEVLKSSALESLHSGHMGTQKTILRAQETMYWINMNNDIQSFIKKCLTCQTFKGQKTKEPLMPLEIAKFPFERISMDILNFKSREYLVIVDSYSKWIELLPLKTKKCSEIISKLKDLFSKFGIPCIIQSDNSPFNSLEIKKFCNEYNIKWWFSSPNYPNSNSSEQAVKICKNILKKSDFAHCDYIDLLTEYRATKIPELKFSPSEIMMGRVIRTKIIINPEKLKPIPNLGEAHCSLKIDMKRRQNKQKQYYDRKTRVEHPFHQDENVLVREGDRWIRGKIVKQSEHPRSYWVQTEKGSMLRRNTFHLKHSPIVFKESRVNKDNFDDIAEIHYLKPEANTNATLIDQNCSSSSSNLSTNATLIDQNCSSFSFNTNATLINENCSGSNCIAQVNSNPLVSENSSVVPNLVVHETCSNLVKHNTINNTLVPQKVDNSSSESENSFHSLSSVENTPLKNERHDHDYLVRSKSGRVSKKPKRLNL
uniref:RNA-directed DNA polymerase n=1 Tax=Cacopsylla melanoneura TaxID=428564 RepID=A0A8D8RDX6_9HEMI